MLRKLTSYVRALLHRDKVEHDMDRELRFHLEMEIEENVRSGMSLTEARRKLLRLKLVPAPRGVGDRVVDQRPRWNVAAGAGLPVTLLLR